jgi:hypothetical protein
VAHGPQALGATAVVFKLSGEPWPRPPGARLTRPTTTPARPLTERSATGIPESLLPPKKGCEGALVRLRSSDRSAPRS